MCVRTLAAARAAGERAMASFAAPGALRARWGELLEGEADVGAGVRSVVGWLKQASLEVRAAAARTLRREGGEGGDMDDSLLLLHYNDVYNIEQTSNAEPVGGAARFVSALRARTAPHRLVLFSGDAFSPSMLSTCCRGEQMVPVLNAAGTDCAVFGNHDFDFGLEALSGLVAQCRFPWLMSNVVDRETGRPLGDGRISAAFERGGRRIGLIGLVEQEWLETLATINPEEVTYIDFAEAGTQLARQLKQEGCDLVVALTHMRAPNDAALAAACPDIDLILGGHDHDYSVTEVNGKLIVKSGTDFREFSCVHVTWGAEGGAAGGGGAAGNGGAVGGGGAPSVRVERCEVTSQYPEDPELKAVLDKYSAMVEGRMGEELGRFSVELEGRFSCVRRAETNLGNWVCDVILAATGADLVILNSGTFRSDRVHPAGPFTLRDLAAVVPMRDPLALLAASGEQLLQALENAVSKYPSLEGRFPQVAGISFAFDPRRPAGSRVIADAVKVGDEYLQRDQTYRLAVKSYLRLGNDGYTVFKQCPVLVDEDMCPEVGLCIQNHFQAIRVRTGRARHSRHRQSLLTLSRRHSLVKMLESNDSSPAGGAGGGGGGRRASASEPPPPPHNKVSRRASLDDLEAAACELAPRVDGRIIVADTDLKLLALQAERARPAPDAVIREDDETGH